MQVILQVSDVLMSAYIWLQGLCLPLLGSTAMRSQQTIERSIPIWRSILPVSQHKYVHARQALRSPVRIVVRPPQGHEGLGRQALRREPSPVSLVRHHALPELCLQHIVQHGHVLLFHLELERMRRRWRAWISSIKVTQRAVGLA